MKSIQRTLRYIGPRLFHICTIPVIVAATGLCTGCAARPFDADTLRLPRRHLGDVARAPANFDPQDAEETGEAPDPRALPMFLGETGEVVSWRDVLRAAAWANVIMMGEEHDDAVGHAVQLAIMQDLTARFDNVALSMEMLERDEQRLVDDFLDGIIDAEDFATLTHSERWAGENSWQNWYQPIIDAAKAAGGRVIAANAPRRYVRLARSHGFDRLRDLPRERRDFVALPRGDLDSPYRDRFFAVMQEMSQDDAEGGEDASVHAAPDPMLAAMFRSQITWDATMADSIDRALRHTDKVVHLAGRFHIGFDGGTVEQLRRRNRGARVLTIVMSKDDALELRDDDRGLADIVIYTGKRLEREEDDAAEEVEDVEDEAITDEPPPGAGDPGSPTTDHPHEPDAR